MPQEQTQNCVGVEEGGRRGEGLNAPNKLLHGCLVYHSCEESGRVVTGVFYIALRDWTTKLMSPPLGEGGVGLLLKRKQGRSYVIPSNKKEILKAFFVFIGIYLATT